MVFQSGHIFPNSNAYQKNVNCHKRSKCFPRSSLKISTYFQMENSRKSYESATQQLVSFLEHVTTMLQATSPSQRKLFEATKAQVLKTTGKNYKHRFSLGSQVGDSIFRAESMPGNLLINHGTLKSEVPSNPFIHLFSRVEYERIHAVFEYKRWWRQHVRRLLNHDHAKAFVIQFLKQYSHPQRAPFPIHSQQEISNAFLAGK